jgi:hypothetical protein
VLCCAFASAALAHNAPQSFVRFEFLEHSVRAELRLPESEYAAATAERSGADTFEAYLLRHVSAHGESGAIWAIEIIDVRNITYLEHPYRVAELVMTPPASDPLQSFTFRDDAITHEVRNHVIVVTARAEKNSRLLGALQYPALQLRVDWPAPMTR